MKHTIAKGLFDILPYQIDDDWRFTPYYQFVEQVISKIAAVYNYQEIRTPVFEKTDVFSRSVGSSSDIVTKEMYTFEDKAGRSMSLRPEGTAPVIRSFVEKNLQSIRKVHKLYYIAPMFRYERPQAGRYRQHHQLGVEAIGVDDIEQDAEIIDLLFAFYKNFGLKNLNLQINTVGDKESRASFRKAFVSFLTPYFEELSEDSKIRFEKNPLRILDSKNPRDKEILEQAPSILEYLNETSKKEFENLLSILEQIQIPYTVNDKLVRGLDYYNKTVFEVTAEALGAQNSIGGGGRYDGLIAEFNGPELPSIGFGTGIERIIQTMCAQKVPFPEKTALIFYIAPLVDGASRLCFQWIQTLRHLQIACDIDWKSKKPKQVLQQATLLKTRFVLLVGSDELEKNMVTIKDCNSHEQKELPFTNILETLKQIAQNDRL